MNVKALLNSLYLLIASRQTSPHPSSAKRGRREEGTKGSPHLKMNYEDNYKKLVTMQLGHKALGPVTV